MLWFVKIQSENVTLVDITDALEANGIVLHNLLWRPRECTLCCTTGLLKSKLFIIDTKNIIILKQEQVTRNPTGNAAQSIRSIVVRHVY